MYITQYTVVGEQEVNNGTANVRTRDNVVHGEKTLDELVAHFTKLKASKSADDKEKFLNWLEA